MTPQPSDLAEIEIKPDMDLARLIGATILAAGVPSGLALEGGGLAITYRLPGLAGAETLLLAFNEQGFWVEGGRSEAS